MPTDKVALITGGGTGIGRATALRLAREGVAVAVNYSRSEGDAGKTLADVKAAGAQGLLCQADVGDDGAVRAMVEKVRTDLGPLDILVNNAGTTDFVPMEDLEALTDDHWNRVLTTNVKGLFQCSRAAAPQLKERKGCIINVTSVAGVTGQGSSIAYAASKAAAISVSKSLARVLAPEVRVISIAPGIVMTRWVEGRDEHIRRLSEATPLGRAAEPEDVAELVYAAIHHAPLVTGQNLIIDGGMFM
jgi:3-oxoacyl-[acyl-carrier protein] reductase